MIRSLHRWPGLIAAVFLIILAMSGAFLAVLPAAEVYVTSQAAAVLSVADLTQTIQASHPGVEQIRRAASGRITAYWFVNGTPGAAVVDPATGMDIGSADPNGFVLWLTDLHRSLLLGDAGRWTMAAAALAMVGLALSGAVLVARRMGGWRHWFGRSRGPLTGRLHLGLGRFAVVGVLLSSVTALWMTASTFGFLPDEAISLSPPDTVSGQTGAIPADMALLQQTPVSSLRELTFPYPNDATDVFTLKTDTATTLLDQGTGEVVASAGLTAWQWVSEVIYMVHTGRGASVLGLVLGGMVLAVPGMAVTGALTWWAGRRNRPKLVGNAAAGVAENILLVASENGSTWGFAGTLHAALRAAGQKVHAAPLNSFDPGRYLQAKRIVILAATYGDGDAPVASRGFIDRLTALTQVPRAPLVVLGFGNRSFPDFCGFAERIATVAEARGWAQLLPMDTVDRQSPQDFNRWGKSLGAAIGVPLDLIHQPENPIAHDLTLIRRSDYGAEVQAPTAILRFALPKSTLWQRLRRRAFPKFAAGDLIGILPQGSDVPRFYSLASGSQDGFAEICVRKHPGGVCSGQLIDLAPGGTVRGFVRPNPSFRPKSGRAPVILIGAGTGIGPLAGFVRANRRRQPFHLFFGARDPRSDMLYGPDLTEWAAQGRLTTLTTAFSRSADKMYVQDALRRDAARIVRLMSEGAQILVCGGREMAGGVQAALADILAPSGLSPASLKAQGRYAEDVY